MRDTSRSKAQLRSTLRRRRQSLGVAAQRTASLAVARHVTELPGWPGARRIALYLAADGEIDTWPLSELARADKKQLFLPVIEADNKMVFAEWLSDRPLVPNRYGIPEPPAGARRCPVVDLDVVFLPLVGWDRRGGRLGMGAGFYDRALSGVTRALLVGLAHSCQEVRDIPREDWDRDLDYFATDTALYHCQGAK